MWTKEQDEFLKKDMQRFSYVQIIERMKIKFNEEYTIHQLKYRAYKLGFKMSNELKLGIKHTIRDIYYSGNFDLKIKNITTPII